MTKKHLIPDDLLPDRYKGKGYRITETGKVYGVRGHLLKQNSECEYGFNAPKVLGRNLWWLLASMFVDNPNGFTKVIARNGQVEWVDDDEYYKLLAQYKQQDKVKGPITEQQQKYIRDNLGRMSDSLIADTLGISRMTVYRYKKQLFR